MVERNEKVQSIFGRPWTLSSHKHNTEDEEREKELICKKKEKINKGKLVKKGRDDD